MFNEITAQQIMARKLITLKPYDSIYDGLKRLLNNKISGAPVVDDNGQFIGLFTEKSCMNVIIADQYHGLKNTDVASFMYKEVTTIGPDTSLIEIGMLFMNQGVRRLPVVEEGRLLGQVSRRDVLRAVDNERKRATRKSKPPTAVPYYSAVVDPRESSENSA